MDAEDTVTLGGNIELAGFRELEGGSAVILKKIIGTYARRFSEICEKLELLKLQMKRIHEREKSEKYELHGFVIDNGKHYNASVADANLFFALDRVLKKLESEIAERGRLQRQGRQKRGDGQAAQRES
ncbi:hypothetical protein HYU15_00135 [Candidatus Woesearchaeota archaeon]|nr:hypothetical protein [Candidatus Woesearchaeota archaeon]